MLRNIGDIIWFEYHCKESHNSPDAPVWYRSHSQVKIIAGPFYDNQIVSINDLGDNIPSTMKERSEIAYVLTYRVSWPDGFEWDVFEDELLDSVKQFDRPDPPSSQTV